MIWAILVSWQRRYTFTRYRRWPRYVVRTGQDLKFFSWWWKKLMNVMICHPGTRIYSQVERCASSYRFFDVLRLIIMFAWSRYVNDKLDSWFIWSPNRILMHSKIDHSLITCRALRYLHWLSFIIVNLLNKMINWWHIIDLSWTFQDLRKRKFFSWRESTIRSIKKHHIHSETTQTMTQYPVMVMTHDLI